MPTNKTPKGRILPDMRSAARERERILREKSTAGAKLTTSRQAPIPECYTAKRGPKAGKLVWTVGFPDAVGNTFGFTVKPSLVRLILKYQAEALAAAKEAERLNGSDDDED